MERIDVIIPREGWEETIARDGLVFSATYTERGMEHYWREDRCYRYTRAEADKIGEAGSELWQMLIKAGDYMLEHPGILRGMGFSEAAIQLIRESWDHDWPHIYARYDLRYAGPGPLSDADPSLLVPKLYEINADTPTCLLESAVIQWQWFLDTGLGKGQWADMHEMLIEAWKFQMRRLSELYGREVTKIFFAYSSSEPTGEDRMNTAYMMQTAALAGFGTELILIEDIRFNPGATPETTVLTYKPDDGRPEEHIDAIFKLWPWEWLLDEEQNRFAGDILADMGRREGAMTWWIEPIWKVLWSNKAVLAVLWKLFPNHPNLIPAYFEDDPAGDRLRQGMHVRKPILSREGANVQIRDGDTLQEEMPGEYGDEGFVLMAYMPPPCYEFDGHKYYPIVGLWMVQGDPAGIGIRESVDTPITNNGSTFGPSVRSDD